MNPIFVVHQTIAECGVVDPAAVDKTEKAMRPLQRNRVLLQNRHYIGFRDMAHKAPPEL
jgi:hypothetical protein